MEPTSTARPGPISGATPWILVITAPFLHVLGQMVPVPAPWGAAIQFLVIALLAVGVIWLVLRRRAGRFLLTSAPRLGTAALWVVGGLAAMQLPQLAITGGLFSAADNKTLASGLNLSATATSVNLGVILASVVMAPVAEELLYRGMVFGGLREGLRRWMSPRVTVIVAAVLSAVVFTMVHPGSPVMHLVQAFGATVWALSYHYTKSLAVSVVAHSLSNGWVFWTVMHGPNRAFDGGTATLALIVLGPVLAWALTRLAGMVLGSPRKPRASRH